MLLPSHLFLENLVKPFSEAMNFFTGNRNSFGCSKMLIDHLKAAGISRVHDLWVFKLSVLIASLFLNSRKLVVVECGHADKRLSTDP